MVHEPKVEIGDIYTIVKIWEDGDISTINNVFKPSELELVEEPETVMNELTKALVNQMIENPAASISKLSEMIDELNKEIEKIKTELKNKQSRIDYLEGQVSVYERFIKEE